MKKPEKKETKKKAAPVKKAAPKAKKEIKKEHKPVEHKAAEHKPVKKSAPKPEIAHKPESAKPHHVVETVSLVEKPHVEEKKAEVRHVPHKKNPPSRVQYHGIGGRKSATARVWLYAGSGNYMINGRPMENYALGRRMLTKMAMDPFVVTNTVGKYDVKANVNGGGYAAQVNAVSNGVSRALLVVNPDFRPALKKAGLLTRDPREKERKKYGQKKARKRFQYSKR